MKGRVGRGLGLWLGLELVSLFILVFPIGNPVSIVMSKGNQFLLFDFSLDILFGLSIR